METAHAVLRHFPVSGLLSVEPLTEGHTNESYRVTTTSGDYILQKINIDVDPASDQDIWNVTEHVHSRGILTPRIIRTTDGGLVHDHAGSWRLMTFIRGSTIPRVSATIYQLASAARCVGRFHAALADYAGDFAPRHTHFHDTPYIIQTLVEVDTAHSNDPKYDVCHPVAETITARYHAIPKVALPLRAVHGDPKLANIVFDTHGTEAIAMIDFGTVGRYPLPLEVGDMIRSFCLSTRYDAPFFDADVWKASLSAYRESAAITDTEWSAIPDGLRTIVLELAARYLIDAYTEMHFAPDTTRYANRFEQGYDKSRRLLTFLDDAERKGIRI